MADHWKAQMICCGRDEGTERFATWADADEFRNAYTSGGGVDPHGYSGHTGLHQRAVIVKED